MTALLTLVEMAELLRISTRTLRRWVIEGIVPAIRVKRRLLFQAVRVEQALARRETRGRRK